MTKIETIPSVEEQKARAQHIKDAMGVYGD